MLTLNCYQKDLGNLLKEISDKISKKNIFGKSKIDNKGIYIYGSTGCGKTMLSREFYEGVKIPKKFVHYQEFIQSSHKILHEQNLYSKIEVLAKNYASEFKLLCVDEFEIKDITDAMLVSRLFQYLCELKVYILLTSNTVPNNLYMNGIQRESFLPFIGYLEKNFLIHNLKSDFDYRFLNEKSDKIIITNSDEAKTKFVSLLKKLTNNYEYETKNLQVFGRDVVFTRTHGSVLVVSFDEICRENFSTADYIEICKNFDIMVLENVQEISENETDVAIRFINFIDNTYFNKIKLFMSSEIEIENIYKSGSRFFEFKRTISRIKEMNALQ